MTLRNSIHIEITCIQCQKTLGYYEVQDRDPLLILPRVENFYCEECLTKKEAEAEGLK